MRKSLIKMLSVTTLALVVAAGVAGAQGTERRAGTPPGGRPEGATQRKAGGDPAKREARKEHMKAEQEQRKAIIEQVKAGKIDRKTAAEQLKALRQAHKPAKP